mmetsp:Transcript_15441/g.48705  ORF Transcript_15441/g.48705 Transcript_15441/m.48705 type:complete len:331 (+) Transcript_15441:564-1556(+)
MSMTARAVRATATIWLWRITAAPAPASIDTARAFLQATSSMSTAPSLEASASRDAVAMTTRPAVVVTSAAHLSPTEVALSAPPRPSISSPSSDIVSATGRGSAASRAARTAGMVRLSPKTLSGRVRRSTACAARSATGKHAPCSSHGSASGGSNRVEPRRASCGSLDRRVLANANHFSCCKPGHVASVPSSQSSGVLGNCTLAGSRAGRLAASSSSYISGALAKQTLAGSSASRMSRMLPKSCSALAGAPDKTPVTAGGCTGPLCIKDSLRRMSKKGWRFCCTPAASRNSSGLCAKRQALPTTHSPSRKKLHIFVFSRPGETRRSALLWA